ncbi:magnesium transporter [Aeromicrobium ginsengisoli]|uniref:Magnesium transporter n=1 Tax=Aeromicrobium ginsengisoli TaxID=363867 RepID=A0A5M4F9Z9_9ACTN|nr:magnesium transporter [Aeromicrobium ginsengisoli]KAA1395236.1 magnesium transporter [Aeromicrobium ginsengisoli]
MPTRIHLSRMTKLAVVSADQRPLGRVVDVSAILSAETPRLHHLAIGTRRRLTHLVPWSLVASRDDLRIRLAVDSDELEQFHVARGSGPGDIALDAEEVLLGRDVLDSQVVDLSGRRLSRVADVLLADDGDALVVVGVDVGLGALLRRLGLSRLGDRMQPALVDWKDLHLASARGHSVQLATSTDGMRRLDPDALAEVLARLATEPATEVMRVVGPTRSAAALQASHGVHRRRLLRALPPEEAHRLIEAAPPAVAPVLAQASEQPPANGRRFRRTAGWRVHRPPTPKASGP